MNASKQKLELQSPESIMETVTRVFELIDEEKAAFTNRRLLPRRQVMIPVVVQFLDEDYQETGAPVEAVSQDISLGGLGFLCPPVEVGEYAIVEFPEQLGIDLPLCLKIRYTSMVGPFCKVGGSFCANWSG